MALLSICVLVAYLTAVVNSAGDSFSPNNSTEGDIETRWIWGPVIEETTQIIEQNSTETTQIIEQNSTETTQIIEQNSTEMTQIVEQNSTETTQNIEQNRTETTQIIEQNSTETTQIIENSTETTQNIEQNSTETTQIIEQNSTETTQIIEQNSTETTQIIEQNSTETTQIIEQNSIETTPDPNNPCKTTISSVPPNFRAQGMANSRISEIKCAEYKWYMYYRNEVEHLNGKCLHYLLTHSGPNIPYFVIGGHETQPGEFPHMAAIGWKAATGTWIFKCGGALISEKFVLTAAHCTKVSERDTSVSDPLPKIVRLGDKNIADHSYFGYPAVDVNITRIIIHPLFEPPKTYNDVALMELAESQDFTKYIQPACLWSKPDSSPLGNEAITTGWGIVETATLRMSPELQAATVDLLSPDQCNALLKLCSRKWCGMQDNQICAGKLAGGVDACQGDSGGPLQVKMRPPYNITTQGTMSYVIGVTSFGKGCALPNTPGIYARVSTFIDWIESIVWP